MGIRIHNVHKRFDQFAALDGIDLDIRKGELLASARAFRVGQDHVAANHLPGSKRPTAARCSSATRTPPT